ncbi:MAG: hypothetical protein ACFE7R_09125, partial [Candidatus Hodarchaeota archaeon]
MKRKHVNTILPVLIFCAILSTGFLGDSLLCISLVSGTGSQSAMPSSDFDLGNHRSPVSILVYTEFADLVPDPYNEFRQTITSIQETYGPCFEYENLTDYTQLGTQLDGHDILLIVEQELAYVDNMTTVGAAWASDLA